MTAPTSAARQSLSPAMWSKLLAKYEKPNLLRATGQLLDTFIPYAGLWALMIYLLKSGVSYGVVFPIAILTGCLLIRIFIFFHDCCHGSFFASKRANAILGYITGVLTFTSYEDWRHPHARHHATAGDADRRGWGDVWTLTVDEFNAAPAKTRLFYQLYRNPVIMLGLGPWFMFLLGNRFPHKGVGMRERLGTLYTNLGLLAIATLAYFTIGLDVYLKIQIPVMITAATLGIWMFYVQHQFEDTYWARHDEWSPVDAALQGSSYYKLPKIAQWFTGNIGLHHVHHLRPRIPNYNLQQCYDEVPELHIEKPLTFINSLKSLNMHVWDEANAKLISFSQLKRRSKA